MKFLSFLPLALVALLVCGGGTAYFFPKTAARWAESLSGAFVAPPDSTAGRQPDMVRRCKPSEAEQVVAEGFALDIPAGALSKKTDISVTRLHFSELPPLDAGMINVTPQEGGFRCLPHGVLFLRPVSLHMAYDSCLIPEGYSAQHVCTYFFDEKMRRWEQLPKDTLLASAAVLVSRTEHFTDFINAIIKLPDAPETQGYKPTSIKDLKAADASAGITPIALPTANNTGAASLQFPFKLPAPRQGVGPQLALRYNSEGGNGPLGLGWDMSLPSIGIETGWGVPRYDPDLQTETYTMGGEMLTPLAHRAAFAPRQGGEVRFYPRVEGSFSKIVRHGDSPKNYWWEVTNTDGSRSFYGGDGSKVDDNAVLRDDLNGGNIAQWMLRETRDLNGNFVRYRYRVGKHSGVAGGSEGWQIYLESVTYTGHGMEEGRYTVKFKWGLGRNDIGIDCSLGFKKVAAERLDGVDIFFDNKLVRAYEFEYTLGAFYKTLLASVTEHDAEGKAFYRHKFDYWDEVRDGNGEYQAYSPEELWAIPNEDLKADLYLEAGPFNGDASNINTSESKGWSGNLAATVGPIVKMGSKEYSAGGSFGLSRTESNGIVSLVDIDGNGLVDRVFRKNGSLRFNPNRFSSGKSEFGPAVEIQGLTSFSKSKTKTRLWGLEANPPYSFVGYNNARARTTTSTYFVEANRDGRIDIASGGKVYFNQLDAAGNIVFKPSSANTDNPVVPNAAVSPDVLDIDPNEAQALRDENPLHDVVRMWRPPYAGRIRINAPVRLIEDTSPDALEYESKDGVTVAVQRNGTQEWKEAIGKDNFSTDFFPIDPSKEWDVDTSDRFYFRLQSNDDGAYDQVRWDPEITYISLSQTALDANGRPIAHFKASTDFLLTAPQTVSLPHKGEVRIEGVFSKPVTSDSVTVEVLRKNDSDSSAIFRRNFLWSDAVTALIRDTFLVEEDDELSFRVSSLTQVDWQAIDFHPRVSYINIVDSAGTHPADPLLRFDPVVDYTMFNYVLSHTIPISSGDGGTFTVAPFYVAPNDSVPNGMLTLSLKGLKKHYGSVTFSIVGNQMPVGIPPIIADSVPPNEPLFVEYHIIDDKQADTLMLVLGEPRATVTGDGKVQSVTAGVFSTFRKKQEMIFGHLYRGWGQFAYDGNHNRAKVPINEAELMIDPNMKDPKVKDNIKNPEDLDKNGVFDPTKAKFIMLIPDLPNNTWRGYDDLAWLSGDQMSSSRMGEDEVTSVLPGYVGTFLPAPEKKSESTTHSVAVGGGYDFPTGPSSNIGANGSLSTSWTKSNTKHDFIDFNRDGWNDWISRKKVQFTDPLGGLMPQAVEHGFNGSHQSRADVDIAITAGGSFAYAKTTNTGVSGKADSKVSARQSAQAQSQNNGADQSGRTASLSLGLSGNFSKNEEETEFTWLDVNGDGLPDRVDSNLVALNLGYRFLPFEVWDFGSIQEGEGYDTGGGGTLTGALGVFANGINKKNLSFSAGVSLSLTDSETKIALRDLNGDGLVDIVTTGNPMRVQFNLGSSFSKERFWNGIGTIETNSGTGSAINFGFTFCFSLGLPPIKICINPSGSLQKGASRQNSQLTDIDGDGFDDMLRSNHDDDLRVQLSTISYTNLLKTVHSPLGGSFSLHYKRTLNTYALPQSKWTLSEVTTDDGIADDGPNGKITFTYESGRYDRRERNFYGFQTVTTAQWDTQKNKEYRRTVQVYDNANYYTKGTLLRETLQDAAGRVFTETAHTYALRDAITQQPFQNPASNLDGTAWNALLRTEKHHHEGQPTAGLTATTTFEYDAFGNIIYHTDALSNAPDDLLTAQIEYHSLPNRYLYNVPKSITVNDLNGEIRRRDCAMDSSGNVTAIRQYLNAQITANYDMEYDVYGNLTKITRPPNYKNERMTFAYTYDPVVQTYPLEVLDAYGHRSKTAYDYAFGLPLETTDLNGERIRYTLDAKGRVSTITGPYELAAGLPYTIAFDYDPDAPVAYARTRHYDPETGGDIETYTFMDGFQRPVQVKKTGAMFAGDGVPDAMRMLVSGRVKFDAFGRTIEARHPVAETLGTEAAFNTNPDNIAPARTEYDVLDRPLKTILPDGATTQTAYAIGTDNTGYIAFQTTVTDPLGNVRETFTDLRGRKRADRAAGPDGDIWTHFRYNAIGELLRVIDTEGNLTTYGYDRLGRTLFAKHPDMDSTAWTYDLAGNKLSASTPQVRASIADTALIRYTYDYTRLTEVFYPKNYQNNVRYHYGEPGAKHGRAGRIWLQEDASGGQEYFYGPLGEVVKTIRSVLINTSNQQTFVWENTYDTWNRIQTMTYPDGEIVDYAYNAAGKLRSMNSTKDGHAYPLVTQLGYDKFEQRTFLRLGNNTVTTYAYEPERRRLRDLTAATAAGRPMMTNRYTYDAADNVTAITNSAAHNGQMGGKTAHTYTYDALYRLTAATGTWQGPNRSETYTLAMRYDNQHNILRKTQTHLRNGEAQFATTYDNTYAYASPNPHAPTHIGKRTYTYDLDGNTTGWTSNDHFSWRRMLWDEEKHLMAVSDNGFVTRATYDAGGNRVLKSSGGSQGVSVNGSIAGAIHHEDNYTAYISPYLVAREGTFTKHYFIESERIVSKIGQGHFQNKFQFKQGLTAGNLDYHKRMAELQQAAQRFASSVGRPPGIPTQQQHALASEPEQTGVPYPAFRPDTNRYEVPPSGWGLVPKVNPSTEPPGTPVKQEPGPTNDKVPAGYGFNPGEKKSEDDRYFFHPDHLGSTSYVTNAQGEVRQHLEYLPFGEAFAEENSTEGGQAYRFTGKELDEETGLYYFGARYYDPYTSVWQNVDPLAEKYPGWSGYNYVMLNPVGVVDPDGQVPYALRGKTTINKENYQGEPNTIVRTSKYREERSTGTSPHIGVDYRAPIGTPFYSLGDGTIKEIGETKSGIKYIKVEYGDGDVLRFLHISEIAKGVEKGSKVYEGQELGKTGNTGRYKNSKGEMVNYPPHLHVDGTDKQGNSIDPEAKNYGKMGTSESLGEKPVSQSSSKGTESGPIGKRLYRPEGSRTGRLSEE